MLSSKCSPERTSGVRGIGSAPVPWAKAGHARNCAAAAAPPIAIVFTNRRRLDPRTQIPVSPFCRPIFLPRACSHVDIPPHVTHITRGVVLRKAFHFVSNGPIAPDQICSATANSPSWFRVTERIWSNPSAFVGGWSLRKVEVTPTAGMFFSPGRSRLRRIASRKSTLKK
jgi:hypothetical protein